MKHETRQPSAGCGRLSAVAVVEIVEQSGRSRWRGGGGGGGGAAIVAWAGDALSLSMSEPRNAVHASSGSQ